MLPQIILSVTSFAFIHRNLIDVLINCDIYQHKNMNSLVQISIFDPFESMIKEWVPMRIITNESGKREKKIEAIHCIDQM